VITSSTVPFFVICVGADCSSRRSPEQYIVKQSSVRRLAIKLRAQLLDTPDSESAQSSVCLHFPVNTVRLIVRNLWIYSKKLSLHTDYSDSEILNSFSNLRLVNLFFFNLSNPSGRTRPWGLLSF
jgi:hypothetical protein